MKKVQSVLLVLDDPELLNNSAFWKNYRRFIYGLRDYYFKSEADEIRIFTARLDIPGNGLKSESIETYAVRENSFSESISIKEYFSSNINSPDETELPGLMFVFTSGSVKNENIFNELSVYAKYEKTCKFISCFNTDSSQHKIVSENKFIFTHENICNFEKALKGKIKEKKIAPEVKPASEKIKTAKKVMSPEIKKRTFIIAAACVLAAVLIPVFAFVIPKINNLKNRADYYIVNVRDGDRLIFRTAPDRSSNEWLRLYDDEVLMLIEEGETFNKVEYHGLEGYVSRDYILKVDADSVVYEIVNPMAMFEYGSSLLVNHFEIDGKDGWYWIEKAANENHIASKWELAKQYKALADENPYRTQEYTEKYISTLKEIVENTSCVESKYCDELTAMSESSLYSEEVRNNLKKVSDDRKKSLLLNQSKAAKRLSNYYFDIDIELAASYYERYMDFNGKIDPVYLYKLAWGTVLNDETSEYFLYVAGIYGHGDSYAALGFLYNDQGKVEDAQDCFKKALENNCIEYYTECNWQIGLYLWNGNKEYYAVPYFEKVYNSQKYDNAFYQSCYALGMAYEYGYRYSKNTSNALYYYGIAKDQISGAMEAYNRLNNKNNYWW